MAITPPLAASPRYLSPSPQQQAMPSELALHILSYAEEDTLRTIASVNVLWHTFVESERKQRAKNHHQTYTFADDSFLSPQPLSFTSKYLFIHKAEGYLQHRMLLLNDKAAIYSINPQALEDLHKHNTLLRKQPTASLTPLLWQKFLKQDSKALSSQDPSSSHRSSHLPFFLGYRPQEQGGDNLLKSILYLQYYDQWHHQTDCLENLQLALLSAIKQGATIAALYAQYHRFLIRQDRRYFASLALAQGDTRALYAFVKLNNTSMATTLCHVLQQIWAKKETLALCAFALKQKPMQLSLSQATAQAYYSCQEYLPALDLWQQGLCKLPEAYATTFALHISFNKGLALCYAQCHDYYKASTYSLQALQLIEHQLEHFQFVLPTEREVHDLKESQKTLLRLQGMILYKTSNSQRALETLCQAWHCDRNDALSLGCYALALSCTGSHSKALERIAAAKSHVKSYTTLHTLFSFYHTGILRKMGEQQQALILINELKAPSSPLTYLCYDPSFLLLLAACHSYSEQRNQAFSLLQRTLEIIPCHYQALCCLALCHLQQGLCQQALHYTRQALHTYPHSFEARLILALVYHFMDDYQQSLQSYNTLLATYPDTSWAWQGLERLYAKNQRGEQASLCLQHLQQRALSPAASDSDLVHELFNLTLFQMF